MNWDHPLATILGTADLHRLCGSIVDLGCLGAGNGLVRSFEKTFLGVQLRFSKAIDMRPNRTISRLILLGGDSH